MKKSAKVLSILLTAGMLAGSLIGCGGKSGEASLGGVAESGSDAAQASKQAESTSEKDEKEEDEVLEVEIWSSDFSKEAKMTELIDSYNASKGKDEGIQLKFMVNSDVETMLQLAQENGELPMLTDTTHGIIPPYEDGGYILPMVKLPGGQEFLDEWEAKTGPYMPWTKLSGSDDVYSPIYSVSGAALYYNKDMFKEAGIVDENGEAKPPATWSEFLEDCRILTTGSTYGAALSMQWRSFAEYSVMYNSYNSMKELPLSVNWDDLTVSFNCEEQFETIAQIYKEGYCVPGAETIDNDPARSYFSEGIAGMFLGYSWDIGVFTSQYVADFDWDVCQLAAKDGSNYGTRLGFGGHYMPTAAVAQLSEGDQKKVMSVIEWLYGDDVGTALVEAGLVYPYNHDFVEKADTSKLSVQTVHLLDQFSKGRVDAKIEEMWSHVDYENGHGAGLMNDSLLKVCKGEMTVKEMTDLLDEKFTEALKAAVDDGTVIPEEWQY